MEANRWRLVRKVSVGGLRKGWGASEWKRMAKVQWGHSGRTKGSCRAYPDQAAFLFFLLNAINATVALATTNDGQRGKSFQMPTEDT